MLNSLQKRIYTIMEVATGDDKASKFFDIFIIILISLNVLAVIVGTIGSFSSRYSGFLKYFEIGSVFIFTLEYLLRIWTCVNNIKYKRTLAGRLRFAFSPLAIIDLLAILPFYLPVFIALDLRFLRAVRLIRLFRLFKIARYTDTMRTFGLVLKAKKEDLIITIFAIVILLIISSSLMYYLEKDIQPESFSSIPAAMWWSVATLTTVGYGDVYPITVAGRFLGAIVAILGIGLFALPAGIIGSGFIDLIQRRKNGDFKCPHCGELIEK
ncbi:MAG: ion transporter [candidate division Zixibacteria bacterium]|nr:ion transporter [candidate division Zixibacteria bacterium]